MKALVFFLIIMILCCAPSYSIAQENPKDILADITAEVNQDSLTNYVLSLQNLGTRFALAENRKDVAIWIKQKFESFGYQDVILDSFVMTYNGAETMQYNVICRSDSVYDSGDYLLIGAHHDAITYTTPMDSTPGADDNASGVAGVLEIARIMKTHGFYTKIPFHYATWAAEEINHGGSRNYVEKNLEQNSLPKSYINLDMIAYNGLGLRKIQYLVSPEIGQMVDVAYQYADIDTIPMLYNYGSDHMSFDEVGVPFLFFLEGDFNPYYHTNQDRVEYIDMEFLTEVIRGATAAAWYGASANPLVEIKHLINGGSGDDFIIDWELQEEAIAYKLDVYHEGELIQSIETQGDSLYVQGLPRNQKVCVELYSLNEDSIGGYRIRKCIDLSEMPDPLFVNSEMNLDHVDIQWNLALPLDADVVIVERKRKDDAVFELFGEVEPFAGIVEILNHESGIWDYQLKLKDNEGLTSEPVHTSIFAVEAKDDIMIFSGGLGGYLNPDHSDVNEFYENILPKKDYYSFSSDTEENYLPIMQNMEVVIWNSFTESNSIFYEHEELIKSFISNGGKVLLFANKPLTEFGAYSSHTSLGVDTWGYSVGVESIIENDGERLKQLMHTSGVSADVDPNKLFPFMNGSLPSVDAIVENENAIPVLTFQSLMETIPENNFDGETIALKHDSGDGSIIVCGVPLYYFKENESKVLLKKMLEDDMMVGNREIASSDKVMIYPNPVQNFVYIKNTSDDVMKGVLNILDISGKIVDHLYIDIAPSETMEYNIDIPSGIYFLTNKKLMINDKLIVE
jgi:aminopeptidase YwaD